MKNKIQNMQLTAADQAEMLLKLLRVSFEGNQEMLEFNATMAKRTLNLIAKHSKTLITDQQMTQNPLWLNELAQEANQACSDYLLGSKALISSMQSQINALLMAQAEQFGAALAKSVGEIKPAAAGQEIIDLTVRAWTGALHIADEPAIARQKENEITSASKLLAALSVQASRGNAGEKRRSSARIAA
jgi:hypothetical protein